MVNMNGICSEVFDVVAVAPVVYQLRFAFHSDRDKTGNTVKRRKQDSLSKGQLLEEVTQAT